MCLCTKILADKGIHVYVQRRKPQYNPRRLRYKLFKKLRVTHQYFFYMCLQLLLFVQMLMSNCIYTIHPKDHEIALCKSVQLILQTCPTNQLMVHLNKKTMLALNCYVNFLYELNKHRMNFKNVGLRNSKEQTLALCCAYFLCIYENFGNSCC